MQYLLLNGSTIAVLDIFEPGSSILVQAGTNTTVKLAIHNRTSQHVIISLESGSTLHIGESTAVGPNTIRLGPQVSIYELDLPTPLDGLYVCDTTTITLSGVDMLDSSGSDTY